MIIICTAVVQKVFKGLAWDGWVRKFRYRWELWRCIGCAVVIVAVIFIGSLLIECVFGCRIELEIIDI